VDFKRKAIIILVTVSMLLVLIGSFSIVFAAAPDNHNQALTRHHMERDAADTNITAALAGVMSVSGNYTYTVINESAKTAQLNRIDGASGAVDIPNVIDGYTITSLGNTINGNIFVSTDFAYNDTVTSVTIPDSVTYIGVSAFSSCYNLTSVTIPNSVTSIGKWAFEDCSSLTSVTIPDSVTSIGVWAFSYCESLTAINVAAGNLYYKSLNGVLFSKDGTELIQYPAGKTGLTYQIPNSVTYIGVSAFEYCYNLTSVTIPDSVTDIGEWAFCDCSSLTSIDIPDSVTSIGEWAFYYCDSLTAINVAAGNLYYKSLNGVLCSKDGTELIQYPGGKTGSTYQIPNSVTYIGVSAFEYCYNLTSVTIPNSVTSIGDFAFWDCSNLTSVTIPDSVASIGYGAFAYCGSLTSAYFNGNAPSYFGDYVFDDTAPGFTIYYFAGMTGWTTPTWYGYPTASISVPYSAQITGNNIPVAMTAGQSYSVTITVKNTGSNTWTAAEGYKLGAVGGTDPFAAISQPLGPADSIAPNQSKTFSFIMTAPAAAGSYTTDWRMMREGVEWFGGTLTKSVTVTAAATNNAQITSYSLPESMTAGQSYSVTITVKNTGTSTWTAADGYKLGAVGNSDSFTASTRVLLGASDSIAPGQSKTFSFIMTAPAAAGSYTTDWRMLKEGVTWFGATLTVPVYVAAATNNAQIASYSLPESMTAGQSYSVTITVKNTGTSTWTAADGYKLGAVGNSDSFTASTRVLLGASDSIAPGQSKTFSFIMTAPAAAGSYTTDWRMLKEGVTWFGATLTVPVYVTAAPYGAQITGSTIPASMIAGQTYSVNVTVKNTGSNTWTAANNYKLGAVGNSDPFAATRQLLSGADSITPNQSKTFTFNMTAPAAGTYTTDWRMLREGVAWFGVTLTKSVTVTAAAPYSAQITSNTIPASMTAGQSYSVNVTVKNTGSNTWTAANNYKLGAVGNSDSFAATRQLLSGADSIAPNQSKTFTFNMTAPAAGTYTTDWRMLREGVAWFGDTLTKSVTVTAAAPYNAQITGNTIPASMTAGQTYSVSVTVKNTGSNTWTAANNYKLGAVGNSDPFAATRQLLSGADSIAPGQSKTFTFSMTAPAAGSYTTDWRMLREGVVWFGDTLTKDVEVSSEVPMLEIKEIVTTPASSTRETRSKRHK
jgi:uncharacterized membrane protein